MSIKARDFPLGTMIISPSHYNQTDYTFYKVKKRVIKNNIKQCLKLFDSKIGIFLRLKCLKMMFQIV